MAEARGWQPEVRQSLHALPPLPRQPARLASALERAGRIVGGNDLLIAAHAVALGCTIVTDNVGEFWRIQGLAIENWLR
jgi:tRNA(fMet)-specific endonuclease VapC